jgi:hypothetical protein
MLVMLSPRQATRESLLSLKEYVAGLSEKTMVKLKATIRTAKATINSFFVFVFILPTCKALVFVD